MTANKYHFIAIGGSIMHSLAIALKDAGHDVTGSDDAIYGVASKNLKSAGIFPEKVGWDPGLINESIDTIILGMHARPDNPELLKAKDLGINIVSFPEFIYQWSKEKQRVVIAGSHGKTSTSSMIIYVLDKLGIAVDYIVGAPPSPNAPLVKLSNSPVIIIEGDEYLTSPEDSRPKFLHYHPQIALINGIAWDHANVFPDFNQYLSQFKLFTDSLTEESTLLYYQQDPYLEEFVKESPAGKKIAFDIIDHQIEKGQTFALYKNNSYPLKIFGDHNMQNLAGAVEVLNLLGIQKKDIFESITDFIGAKNRLESLKKGSTNVYTDFAHSPSKVKATVSAVSKQNPNKQLVAVLELHTFSSLNKSFLPEYKNTMKEADVPVLFYDPIVVSKKKLPNITIDEMKEFFNQNLEVFTDIHVLEKFILTLKSDDSDFLFMSSGNFGGMDLKNLSNRL